MIYIKKKLEFFADSKSLIFLVSLIYSIIVGHGYIGFGIDYSVIYYKSNIQSPTMFDLLGWTIATFSIKNIHLGAYITAFIISLSSGFLCRFFFNAMKLNSLFFFIIIYFLILFSWPIIISANNAMRQGIAMAFIFFALIQLHNKKKNLSVFFFIISLFTHKSSLGFFFIFAYLSFFNFLNKNKELTRKSILSFGIILFFISLFYLYISDKYDHDRFEDNVIIGLNFVPIFFLINIFYIFYFTTQYKLLNPQINLYIFFFSLHGTALLFNGLFWQYERYNMSVLLIYIFIFGSRIVKNQKYIYLIGVFSLLLILTFLTGMYTEGIGIIPNF
jgi:hypothetical protein